MKIVLMGVAGCGKSAKAPPPLAIEQVPQVLESAFKNAPAEASAAAARLSRLRYEGGISNFLQVLDAERVLLEAYRSIAAAVDAGRTERQGHLVLRRRASERADAALPLDDAISETVAGDGADPMDTSAAKIGRAHV